MRNLTALVVCLLFSAVSAAAASLYEISLQDIDGQPTTLAPYKGKVLLIVNVASKCGNTPQYKELEALYLAHKEQGFVVLGFPCNQFGGQEPGTNAEIKEFCSLNYRVTFPLFDKIEVNGANRHALYTALSGEGSAFPGKIEWNFAKFLVGRDGRIVARFKAGLKPEAPEVVLAIQAALEAK